MIRLAVLFAIPLVATIVGLVTSSYGAFAGVFFVGSLLFWGVRTATTAGHAVGKPQDDPRLRDLDSLKRTESDG
jgi:hypothetical protein